MIFSWMFSVLLFVQQSHMPDHLTITNKGQPVSTVNREEFSTIITGFPIIDHKKYSHYLDSLEKDVYIEPKNAVIDRKGIIQPEQLGYKIYRKSFTVQFYQYYFNKGPARFEIPLLAIYPKVDSELLADLRSLRIGQYVTSFNVQNKTRTNNIKLAANAINNSVIFPGETFSFNKVVGKRTSQKGYLRAPIIIKGEISEDIGGGICQVSSTLFNAVDNAGLQIIQRFSHTREVPYIPPGRDATVSWYGPDFVFKNKYKQPILIQAKTLGNKLIIKVYSS
ncbi:MAG TPA: VanW family protein, partial [Bacillales bacterium]|nr:VanW family protein [Bacillales bacterium]